MNKIFALMLTAVFTLTGVAAMNTADPAAVEETTVEVESYVAAGTVIEITDDYVVFTAGDGQVFQANITQDTIQEYDLPGAALSAGDYIHVIYDGKTTRSIPAQITAQVIRASVREGQVTAIANDHFLLQTELEEIQVNCTVEQLAPLQQGMQVKVYFAGAMTMSLPAQIGAELIVPVE